MYSKPSQSGYNTSPPNDDGSISEDNKVKWATIKGKLSDPNQVFATAINDATESAFDDLASIVTDDGTKGYHLIYYPILAGETGVTDYEYPVGDVRRYGAKGDYDRVADTGTDDTTAIQNAIDSVKLTKRGHVHAPAGSYLLTSELQLFWGLKLTGDSRGKFDEVVGYLGATTFYGQHTGASVLSLKGASFVTLKDFAIETDPANHPKTGLLLGRNSANSAGHHNIDLLRIQGTFSVAAIYSIASEVNTWGDLYVHNLGSGGKYCFYTSAADDLSVDSLTTSTNLVSVATGNLYLINSSTDAAAACIYMEVTQSMGSWSFIGTYMVPFSGSYVHMNFTGAVPSHPLGPFSFLGCSGEKLTGGDPVYGFRLDASAAASLVGFNVNGTRFDLLADQDITDISVANPAVVTVVGHGLTDQDTHTFTGTNGTPNIDGEHVITRINDDTFSVPVNQTVQGTEGVVHSHYPIKQSSNLTLVAPNIVIQPPESLPYAYSGIFRDQVEGGILSVGRDALWVAPTLENSWVNEFGTPFAQAGYRVDAEGLVTCRGSVSSGSSTIFTFPLELRPGFNHYFTTSGNNAHARLFITASTGAVTVDVGSGPEVDLGAIRFYVGN